MGAERGDGCTRWSLGSALDAETSLVGEAGSEEAVEGLLVHLGCAAFICLNVPCVVLHGCRRSFSLDWNWDWLSCTSMLGSMRLVKFDRVLKYPHDRVYNVDVDYGAFNSSIRAMCNRARRLAWNVVTTKVWLHACRPRSLSKGLQHHYRSVRWNLVTKRGFGPSKKPTIETCSSVYATRTSDDET